MPGNAGKSSGAVVATAAPEPPTGADDGLPGGAAMTPGAAADPKSMTVAAAGRAGTGASAAGSRGPIQRISNCVICSRSIGFASTSSAPAARAAACCSSRTPAVKAITGSAVSPKSARMRRVAARPSSTGICTSISTASKACAPPLSTSSACWPSAARVAVAPSSASARSTRSRFIALSSTTSTCAPASRGPVATTAGAGTGAATAAAATRSSGSSNQKQLPSPGWLSAPMVPPISSTRRLQIDRPSPVPPKRRPMPASAWVKGVNKRASASPAMPMPVSRTSTRRRSPASVTSSARTRTATSPRSVNLIALPTRFNSTCSMRSPSPSSRPGGSAGGSMRRVRPLPCAACPIRLSTLASRAARSKGRGSRRNWPASILDRSSTSLRMASSDWPALRMRSTMSRWLGASCSRSSTWARPSTAFIGVRISWLMWARNSLLAALAAAAAAEAWRRRSSISMRAEMSSTMPR